jgi:integrase
MPRKVNRNPGVAKRGDKWKARAFFDGREISKTFSTQEEAVRWKREQERALERGEWIDPSLSSISFKEWTNMWLQAKTNISASTRRGYVARINSHLLPAFGQSKLTAITNNQIGKWVAVSIENGVGATVIKQSIGLMKQIYNSAVLDGRVSRNPSIGVPLPRSKAKEKKALTINQLKALAKECGDFELLVLFAGTTGLRWGELAALQCKDISLLNRSVNVSKAYSNGMKGEKILGQTKTHQVRTVPFTKELIPALSELIQSRPAESHLFQMPYEGALDYNNFMSRIFRPAVERVGFVGVGFHNLRHTTASLLISQGTPITTVAGILGHASTQMTLDVYGHLYEDDSTKYIDRLGDSLFNTGTDKERTNILSVALKATN